MYSLLDDDLISVQLRGGRGRCALPALLAHLAQDAVVDLPGLQAHQEHPFYALLVQLGAMALHRAGLDAPPTEAADWRPMLLDLADGQESAWHLVEPDLSKPAFLQPPIPEGSLAPLKNQLDTPDALDLLVTAKNHDLKSARAVRATPERWLYALVSCQTMQGFSGRDNYGIARMNSGFGNRPVVALLPSVAWGARFQADLATLARARDKAIAEIHYAEDGVCLAGLAPWAGDTAYAIGELDPWFVEIARRVRLTERGGQISGVIGTSKTPRVAAKERAGVMGDPWTPFQAGAEPSSLTVNASGFTYKLLHRILIKGDFKLPPSVDLDQGGLLLAQAVARGQGKTEGLHERWLAMPRGFVLADRLEQARSLSEQRILLIDGVRKSALYPAINALLNGGELNKREKRVDRWTDGFEGDVDALFFPALWRDLELPPEARAAPFEAELRALAKVWLEKAIASAPLAEARRWRAIAAAESILGAGLFKVFGKFTPTPEATDHVDPS